MIYLIRDNLKEDTNLSGNLENELAEINADIVLGDLLEGTGVVFMNELQLAA